METLLFNYYCYYYNCRPKTRFLRITKDDSFSHELHYLTNVASVAESACSYDIDDSDQAWLRLLNQKRVSETVPAITPDQFEKVVEELEVRKESKLFLISL